MDLWSAVDSLLIVFVSCKAWVFIYGLYLIGYDIIFTLFPTTMLGVVMLFGILNHFKISPPSPEAVREVFGQDVNVLMEAFESGGGRGGPNGLINLPFIPTTSRLAGASEPSTSATLDREEGNFAPASAKPYTMWIVGHRGAGLDAPENSLSAFRLCKSRGCTAVEFDVALTKDLVPVIFHDETLTRVAGINRKIQEMTYEELMEADISATHPLGEKYRGERIPTFQEAITTCLGLDLRFFIDVKDCDPVMLEVILAAFDQHSAMYSRAIVSSFHPTFIYQIRRRNPKIIGCIAYRPCYNRYETWNGNWEGVRFRHALFLTDWFAIVMDAALEWVVHNFVWWFLGLSAILFHKDYISKEATCRWLKKGIRIYAWTVNSPLEKLHLTQNFRIGHLTDTLDGGDLVSITAGGSDLAIPKLREMAISGSREELTTANHSISHSLKPLPAPGVAEAANQDPLVTQ